jgi:GrpB-like predicted nucleotidyltransferase (UPF0157 family)
MSRHPCEYYKRELYVEYKPHLYG